MRSSIFRTIRLLMEFNKVYLPLSIIYKAFQGIIPMVSIIYIQQIINGVQNKSVSFESILGLILCYIGLQILNDILQQLYEKYKYNLLFSKTINIQMMDKATHLSLKDYENKETYNLINRAQNQSGANLISYINSTTLQLL